MTDGNDLFRRIGRAAEAIDPAFTDRDVQRLVAGAGRRARRRLLRGVALGGLGVGAAFLLALRFGGLTPTPVAIAPRPASVAPATAEHPEALRLADGSVATPLDADSALALREDSPQRVICELARGRGHFEVTPRPERLFVVRAGDVTVTVLGTAFTVERVADRIGVTVARGKVMVDWRVGSRRLVAGESGWFPPLMVGGETESAPTAVPRTRPASRAPTAVASASPSAKASLASPSARAPLASPSARASLASPSERASLALPRRDPPPSLGLASAAPLAESPPPSRPALTSRAASPPSTSRRVAAQSVEPPPPASVEPEGDESEPEARESAASLLAAADAARLDGRPADGAALLRRILREHRHDPRAPLAAFTLGRVLLKELDRPRQAAAAFAEARALAPRGPFAEDALAREAEALSAAGETGEAAARAQDYLRRYPNGRRAAAMRAVGAE